MKKLLLFIYLLLTGVQIYAQTDTIRLSGKNTLATAQLKPGNYQYLVYMHNPKTGRDSNMSIWKRNVTFTKWNKHDVIVISQQWFASDTMLNRTVYSISRRDNFQPIYHYTFMQRTGAEAFNFYDDKITGADSVANNIKKDFNITLNEPTLNWELDLEIFNTLPIKKIGQTFMIPFYHPGGRSEPKYYAYTVAGEEKITGTDGNYYDCWQLKINYDDKNYALFWLSKKTKEVLKMQEHFNGWYRYKVRLATPVE